MVHYIYNNENKTFEKFLESYQYLRRKFERKVTVVVNESLAGANRAPARGSGGTGYPHNQRDFVSDEAD